MLRRAAILASGLMLLRGDAALSERIRNLAESTGAAMAGITVMDHETCWLPVCYAADMESIPISESLCAKVVEYNHPLRIQDLANDQELGRHPAVIGPMQVRAYVGVPLNGILGSAIGTVFVADTKPRSDFDVSVTEQLHALAEYIQDEVKLERRRFRTNRTAVVPMMEMIQDAMRAGDDDLVTILDQILRSVEPPQVG